MLPACFLLLLAATQASADTGTVRLSELQGPYQITVLTSPTPLTVGKCEINILVQDGESRRPVEGVRVTVRARQIDGTQEELGGVDSGTFRLHAVEIEFPTPGTWHITVDVQSADGNAKVAFEAEVAKPTPSWLAFGFWIGWPMIPIALFGIHRALVRRRERLMGAGS